MRTKILLGALLAGIIAVGYGLVGHPSMALAEDGGKNLKTFLKAKGKADVKKYMKKEIAEGLGVQCDYCHDTDDMSKDTPKKERAREMINMVQAVNKGTFGGKDRVKCVTCHNGTTKPK